MSVKDVKLTNKYVILHLAGKENIIKVIIHCWHGYREPVFSYIASAKYQLIEFNAVWQHILMSMNALFETLNLFYIDTKYKYIQRYS